MLIKTPEFDTQFLRDLQVFRPLTITGPNTPVRLVGSYPSKEYGSYVTDIDIKLLVRFEKKLLEELYNVITTNVFQFLPMKCGYYLPYKPVWTVNEVGDYIYDIPTVNKWLKTLYQKKLIPTLTKVTDDVCTILKVENMIRQVGIILWKPEDILMGEIVKDGRKYSLLECMSKNLALLKFAYPAGEQSGGFCLVEICLSDKRYKTAFKNKKIKYLLHENYKIFKSFRWKMSTEYLSDYMAILQQKEQEIALWYQIRFSKKVKGVVSKEIQETVEKENRVVLDTLGIKAEDLYGHINDFFGQYIDEYASKIKLEYRGSLH